MKRSHDSHVRRARMIRARRVVAAIPSIHSRSTADDYYRAHVTARAQALGITEAELWHRVCWESAWYAAASESIPA